MAQVIARLTSSFGSIPKGTTVEVIEGFIDDKGIKQSIVSVPKSPITETVPTAIVKIIHIARSLK